MADAVTSQTLFDGQKRAVMKFTNLSDGTGESAVLKVDVSALVGSPTRVAIERAWVSTAGMQVNLLWDATADVLALTFGTNISTMMDFSSFGGITNDAGAGVTGDLLLTTFGHATGEGYVVILEMTKEYA
jgi:hypothetical protein